MEITTEMQLITATEIIRDADTVFILAGAGLSAEVGIPTYWEGDDSLYGAKLSEQGYTALQHANATLWMQDTGAQIAYYDQRREDLASIDFTASIYGTLLDAVKGKDYFCLTSNVDSGFFRAGFDEARLHEVHGSQRYSQCVMDPEHGIFEAVIDGTLACPVCTMPTRPNTLFFNDHFFNPEIIFHQQERYNIFIEEQLAKKGKRNKVVILELGVGITIPRVRQFGNKLYRDFKTADFIHVNLEPEPEFLFGESCSFPNKEHWIQMGAGEFIKAL